MIKEITSIADIQQLVRDGETNWSQYGNVRAAVWGGYILFNYTTAAQYAEIWNFFERVSRGLILDHVSGEVVARPFGKFFNWGERYPIDGVTVEHITTKMDGSLGILWRDEANEGHPVTADHPYYRIATRGGFSSEQAEWATAWLNAHTDLPDLDDSFTLLFEIIYPANRIVVDYGSMECLYLLAAINRHTGEELPREEVEMLAEFYHFPIAEEQQFKIIEQMLRAAQEIDAHHEGWVIKFSDGSRFKVKGEAYKIAHRMLNEVTFRHVLDAIQANTLDNIIANVPDEFLGRVKAMRSYIEERREHVLYAVRERFEDHPFSINETPRDYRARFAKWAMTKHKKYAPYLFAMLDDKDILPLIYKHEFKGVTEQMWEANRERE